MCLVVDLGNKIEIAVKPIEVFKIIHKINNTKWESAFLKTTHRFNDTLIACEHLEIVEYPYPLIAEFMSKVEYKQAILVGFHAFTNKERAIKALEIEIKDSDYYSLVSAIIPSGAEYCLGLCNEIVSNQLIISCSDN